MRSWKEKGARCENTGRLFRNDPDRVRTCDPQIRNLMLYPAELRDLFTETVTSNREEHRAYSRRRSCNGVQATGVGA